MCVEVEEEIVRIEEVPSGVMEQGGAGGTGGA